MMTEASTPAPLIAVVGTGRNGSTLLSRLLDGIPGTFFYPVEVNFLQAINDLACRPSVRPRVHNNTLTNRLVHLDKAIPTDRLLAYYRHQVDDLRRNYLDEIAEEIDHGPHPFGILSAVSSYRAEEFVRSYARACAAWVCGSAPVGTVIFKTIETPYVADYARLFPDMAFIHILRHPQATWSSFKRTGLIKKKRPPDFLGRDLLVSFLKCRWLPHARLLNGPLDSRRHIVVRYEDLVDDPRGEIGRICEWAGLAMPAEPTVQTVLGGRHFRRMPMNPSMENVRTPRDVVKNLGKVFGYDEVVTYREKQLIDRCTAPFLERLGYATEVPRMGAARLFNSWLTTDEWDSMNFSGMTGRGRMIVNYVNRRMFVFRLCLGV